MRLSPNIQWHKGKNLYSLQGHKFSGGSESAVLLRTMPPKEPHRGHCEEECSARDMAILKVQCISHTWQIPFSFPSQPGRVYGFAGSCLSGEKWKILISVLSREHHLYAEHTPCAFYSIFQAGTVVLAAARKQPLVTEHWQLCRYCRRSDFLLNTGHRLGLLPPQRPHLKISSKCWE